jgi:hypothetical protein
MDLRDIRRFVIVALFSDDELMEKFVLKGGNALDLIHGLGSRSSVDVDVSIADDFDDIAQAKERIFRALRDRFDSAQYVVFDEQFSARPSKLKEGQSPLWGGYEVNFKIATRESARKCGNDLEALRRNASLVGPEQKRTFKIDISKHEFCEEKQEAELDNYTIYVYTLPMMAIEKLRAICQQLPEYQQRPYSKARARDFYDIYSIVTEGQVDITSADNPDLLRHIFAAKEVPLELLMRIETQRGFHSTDWDAVRQSVSGELREFDFYYDFVLELVEKLKAARVV